ncbi:S41 family peptidase [Zobellia galactanivorans]|uniref:Carboxy-terminal processing peptidase, family S41 n=1 Tax=Zobellia galactanivorans (strain DSM 12802 / CCUG 47099 / CIP 106680 / NCIMB 13871 / Dsij) TaxID=63186 RepID=G0L5H7_ZOBGA|nr:S41 family peptidase [Zobellia galactanivorans]CAZ96288.1 Carboxy-terminal processing peptidase, family S41 [Zobellia galactanivorans]
MGRFTLIFLITLFFSGQVIAKPTPLNETEKLASVGKVWGFLKYYHPNVAKGKFNWDEQLFTILARTEKTNSKEELSQVLIDWIGSLGEIKPCKSCQTPTSTARFNKNFDLSWIQDNQLFSKQLSDKLRFIETNRFQGKQYYVTTAKKTTKAQNIIIQNEPEYPNFLWKDKNLRLLALFRYWNTVAYFFPYKYQMDTPWNDVLTQILPKFLHPESELDYHLAMLELVVHIDDSHAGLSTDTLNEYFGNNYIPVTHRIIDNKAVIVRPFNDSLARLNDLKIGDVISKVNGQNVIDVFEERKNYIQGSNHAAKLAFARNKIFNGSTDSVTVELLRNGKPITKKIGRYPFKDFNYEQPTKKKYKILNNTIGYVNMGEVTQEDVSQMMDSLIDKKAIIFDIRNYPKGTMYLIANYLNSSPKEFVKIVVPDLGYPGRFKWTKTLKCGGSNKTKEHYKGKIILLVNSQTISRAEFTTMAFQTYDNVMTIGSQTCAADGNVSPIGFVGGFKTGISGTGIFYPDGTKTQRVGVKIDVEVKPTIAGIQEGRDEVLEKALDLLKD